MHENLTRIIVLAVGVAVLGGAVHSTGGGLVASASEPSPSASPSVEPTSTPTPASDAVVRRALRQRHRAVSAWREWSRARSALSLRVVRFGEHSAAKPDRSESDARWAGAGRGWKSDAVEYRERTARLLDRMRKPGGTSSGTRWAALAIWCGWPRSAIHTLTGMIGFQSSGRERAFNDVIDCTGLTAIWPKHVTDRTGMSWSAAIRWLMVAENNLREALRIFRAQGNSFLPAWRGDPAVGW